MRISGKSPLGNSSHFVMISYKDNSFANLKFLRWKNYTCVCNMIRAVLPVCNRKCNKYKGKKNGQEQNAILQTRVSTASTRNEHLIVSHLVSHLQTTGLGLI